MNGFDQKEIKGILMFLGTVGIIYTLGLILIALLTGAKLLKSIVIIGTVSTMLFSCGLQSQTIDRLKRIYQSAKL